MGDPWQPLRSAIQSPAGAIAYACVLEATAPKVGNVHPAASFSDLRFSDFALAAEITSEELTRNELEWGDRILSLVRRTKAHTQTNVNLGIALLLGPIVAAEEKLAASKSPLNLVDWQRETAQILRTLSAEQGGRIGNAIAIASAGGMDGDYRPDDPALDVQTSRVEPYDLMSGMRAAKDRDLIAAEYSCGFETFFTDVVPTLIGSVHDRGDLLSGITACHLTLLVTRGDSLIARKNGRDVEAEIRTRAAACAAHPSPESIEALELLETLDAFLRCDGNRFNPGTTADFLAAAAYICLRLQDGSGPKAITGRGVGS